MRKHFEQAHIGRWIFAVSEFAKKEQTRANARFADAAAARLNWSGTDADSSSAESRNERLPELRVQRQLVPLHSGFGFGAEAIKTKAQAVARAAQARKNQRLAEALTEPLGGASGSEHLVRVRNESVVRSNAAQGAQGAERAENLRPARLPPAPRFGQAELDELSAAFDSVQPRNSVADATEPLMSDEFRDHKSETSQGSTTKNISIERESAPRQKPYLPERPEPVSRAEAFCAWAVDFLFAACVTFVSSLAGRAYYLLKGETLFALLVRRLHINLPRLDALAPEYQALAAVLVLALVLFG